MNTSTRTKTHEPLLVWAAILWGLHTLFAGSSAVTAVLTDVEWLPPVFALGNLAVASAQAGIAFYQRGIVAPMEHVVEYVSNGLVVAGPANEMVAAGDVVRTTGDMGGQGDHADTAGEYHGPGTDELAPMS